MCYRSMARIIPIIILHRRHFIGLLPFPCPYAGVFNIHDYVVQVLRRHACHVVIWRPDWRVGQ
jgi:hypothetical protein